MFDYTRQRLARYNLGFKVTLYGASSMSSVEKDGGGNTDSPTTNGSKRLAIKSSRPVNNNTRLPGPTKSHSMALAMARGTQLERSSESTK